jgi:hypothetical protein
MFFCKLYIIKKNGFFYNISLNPTNISQDLRVEKLKDRTMKL